MNFLTLPVGTVVQIKSKEDVEKQFGSGFVGVERYENQYGIIEQTSQEEGCYRIEGLPYGWDDRLVVKVENPIQISLIEKDGTVVSKQYCPKEDEELKKSILELLEFDKTDYNDIVIEKITYL